jgi:hypothetical protein
MVFILGNSVPALDGRSGLVDGRQFLTLFFKTRKLFKVDPGYFCLRELQDIIDNGKQLLLVTGIQLTLIRRIAMLTSREADVCVFEGG